MPFVRFMQLTKSLAQFSTFLADQVDLSVEARNMERFAENFRNIPNVKFPEVFYASDCLNSLKPPQTKIKWCKFWS